MMLSYSDSEVYVPSLGTIKTIDVEIYWDPIDENKTETLSWDDIKIEKLSWDEIKMVPLNTMYLINVSNFRVTLTFLTDWDPVDILDYLTISWDNNWANINPGEIIPVTMTLSASSSDAFIYYLSTMKLTDLILPSTLLLLIKT